MLLAVLVTKLGHGLPDVMLLANGGADNPVGGGPRDQDWRRAPCRDAASQGRRRQCLWRPCSSILVAGSLLPYCRLVAAQTMLSVVLAIKIGGGLHAGMLLTDGGADNAFAALVIKFSGGVPAGMP